MVMVNQGLRLSDFQAGQYVKVHGKPGQHGTIVASSISIKTPEDTSVIEGPIESLDHQTQSLRILGLELLIPLDAKIQDKSRSRVDFTSLKIGDVAKLKGTYQASGGFVTASIKVQPTEGALLAEVQGRLDSVDPLSATVRAAGFTVMVTDETAINDFPESASTRKHPPEPTAVSLDEDAGRARVFVELSEHLRLPVSGGAALTRVGTDTYATRSIVQSGDHVEHLIDTLNADMLAGLAGAVPGPAYLLAFVSGSPVRSRLQGTRSGWRRLVECLRLDAITRDLQRSFAPSMIDDTLAKLRHFSEASLLMIGSRLGPAKLLFRLRVMDEEVVSGASYEAIEHLVTEMPLLSSDCDDETKALLRKADLGKSTAAVRRRLHLLLRRFDLDENLAVSDQAFDGFVQTQCEAGCLHPALPIPMEAIRSISEALGLPLSLVRQMITLFRFAWLCGQDRAEGVSDFAIKGLVVMPHAQSAQGEAIERADKALQRAYDAVQRVTAEHTDLLRFRERYPDVRIEVAAQVVALPKPLFEVFWSLDGPDERRLDFLTRYRLGAEQFTAYLAEQGLDRAAGHTLDLRDATSASECVGQSPRLFDDVIFLSAKEGKKRAKRGRVTPFSVAPLMLRESLSRTLSSPNDADWSEWTWRVNEVQKCDLVGRIRGVWTLKVADVPRV